MPVKLEQVSSHYCQLSAVSAADVAAIVGKHNECRANVSPPAAKPIPPIVWDASVAASAQAYADTCPEGHVPADQCVAKSIRTLRNAHSSFGISLVVCVLRAAVNAVIAYHHDFLHF
eukprot:19400-Heterococcus_DN1.PRE.2